MRWRRSTRQPKNHPRPPHNVNEQLLSAIRSVLKFAGGALVTKGVTDNSTIEVIIAGIMAAVGIAWSWAHHKETAKTP